MTNNIHCSLSRLPLKRGDEVYLILDRVDLYQYNTHTYLRFEGIYDGNGWVSFDPKKVYNKMSINNVCCSFFEEAKKNIQSRIKVDVFDDYANYKLFFIKKDVICYILDNTIFNSQSLLNYNSITDKLKVNIPHIRHYIKDNNFNINELKDRLPFCRSYEELSFVLFMKQFINSIKKSEDIITEYILGLSLDKIILNIIDTLGYSSFKLDKNQFKETKAIEIYKVIKELYKKELICNSSTLCSLSKLPLGKGNRVYKLVISTDGTIVIPLEYIYIDSEHLERTENLEKINSILHKHMHEVKYIYLTKVLFNIDILEVILNKINFKIDEKNPLDILKNIENKILTSLNLLESNCKETLEDFLKTFIGEKFYSYKNVFSIVLRLTISFREGLLEGEDYVATIIRFYKTFLIQYITYEHLNQTNHCYVPQVINEGIEIQQKILEFLDSVKK